MKKLLKNFGYLHTLVLIGALPLLIGGIILMLYSSSSLKQNLESSVYERLKVSATDVKTWYENNEVISPTIKSKYVNGIVRSEEDLIQIIDFNI